MGGENRAYIYFNFVLINRRKGPQYRRIIALCACFLLTGANSEGSNSSQVLCLMFVYVCFISICVWTDIVILENLWFDDLCVE